jgi:CTP:molybdopterin cytidylyltransferase MocA
MCGILAHYNRGVIPAVVLAAGASTRMGGRPKALLPFDDRHTFLTRILHTFADAGASELVVVVGHEADQVAASIRPSGIAARVVVNAAYSSGQFSSVLAGLEAIDRPDVEAFMMTLVDVPRVSADTVRAVMGRYREMHAPIVRPVRGPLHGHPVLIDRALFSALRSADPATGAKPVVRAHASPAGDVSVGDEGAFLDVDTPEDYSRFRNGAFEDPERP